MLKCTMLSDQNRKWILLPNLQQLFTYDSTVDIFFMTVSTPLEPRGM
jgi:hypothetical protein